MARKIRIPIKTAADIKKMRVACEIASEILQLCAKAVKPGATTGEIDRYAGEGCIRLSWFVCSEGSTLK